MSDEETQNNLHNFCAAAGRSFFDEFGLISHQINSYNDFIDNGIQSVLHQLGEIDVVLEGNSSGKSSIIHRRAKITFGSYRLESPTFWTERHDSCDEPLKFLPKHARLQNMTYSAKLFVEIKVQVFSTENLKGDNLKTGKLDYSNPRVIDEYEREVLIGAIPVMVKSKLCWLHKLKQNECEFDVGGYFIIKGTEKVFIAQEQRCLTRLWTSEKPTWTVQYQDISKRKRIYIQFGRDSGSDARISTEYVTVCFLYATMPVWLLFFALGASSDQEVLQMIGIDQSDPKLVNILLDTIRATELKHPGFRVRNKAVDLVNDLVMHTMFPPSETIDRCFEVFLFPGMEEREKAIFLGYMVKTLLLSWSGKRKCDNIHDMKNKRLDLGGELLRRQMYIQVRRLQKSISKKVQRDLHGDSALKDIESYIDASIISNGFKRPFSVGQWIHPYRRMEMVSGVVATLRRTNALQMISDMRKTRQYVQYSGKSGDARFPNTSFWGKLCFLSTPDGENCGLVKNLALTGLVSTQLREPILEELTSAGMQSLKNTPLHLINHMNKVLLNGSWVGSCCDGQLFADQLRSLRRRKLLHREVEVKWDPHQREVRIFSDEGRLMRPLLIAQNILKAKDLRVDQVSFQSLIDNQLLELIGAEEEEDCRAAWGVTQLYTHPGGGYTHCELDLSFLLGLSCSLIPFANHDLARRVLYQSEKHSQQAIGMSTVNPLTRVDTVSYQLFYPQRPLFHTTSLNSMGKPVEFFNGQNAIVAVNVHQGFNQEDSLVLSRAALERGMFRTELFRCYKSTVDNSEGKTVKKVDKVDFGKRSQSIYGKVNSLDPDGLPAIGARLQAGDMVIGRVADDMSREKVDHSIKLRHFEKGSVHRVVLSGDDDGKNHAAVLLRQVRSPTLGDKFSSMHGQKGVVGLLEAQENFPFTAHGIVPDIVINPHAFPTRQTPGQLLEAALGKAIATLGVGGAATPFSTPSTETISELLHKAGFQRWGMERVCCGRTGELVKGSMVFVGPTFYQRLVHMAEDKVKYRNTGPVHPLTRQPVGERKRYGGVRFGEMERDCLLAHGAAESLRERLVELSDKAEMNVCRGCGRAVEVVVRVLEGGKRMRGPYCKVCKSGEEIVKVSVPYGAKLLTQELFSMGISLKFSTEAC